MASAGAKRRVPGERRVFSLVLALLASPQGLTRREIFSAVYGYADRYSGDADAALERQFERDKSQLRDLGIPIETLDSPLESGNNQLTRYRISKRVMQMPPEVHFTADELALLRLAALAWREGSLTAESRRSAMKVEALGAGLDVQHLGIAPRIGIPEPTAPALQRAIDERLVARFSYRVPGRDAPLLRRVAPLRLHRAESRWHLVAHDLERDSERVFLLSRIVGEVRVGPEPFAPPGPGGADAAIARMLELAATQRATVRVRPGSIAEARLGARGEARADGRLELGTIDFRELAIELAGYGGEVAVLDPPELRQSVMSILSEVREAHAGASSGAPEPAPSEVADRGPAPASAPRDARLNAPERVVLLLALVPYLREHGETPLAQLAATFEVEPETLRDLIEFLGTAGVPGETGTYQDEDLFDIDWDALEREDLVRLTRVVAVDDAPRFAAGERAALIAGLHSLFPLLPEAERAHARSAAEKLGAAAAGEPAESPISITADPADAGVRRAAEAIETRHRLRFSYRDLRGSESSRTVEPVALTQYGSAWYLRAFCLDRLSERTFLVDAMRDVEVLDEPVRALASGEVGGFRGLGPEDVEIEAAAVVHTAALPRIQAFAPHVVAEVDEERRRVIVRLSHPSAAVRLVQAAPGDVTFEGPEAARRAIHAWADAALGEYDA